MVLPTWGFICIGIVLACATAAYTPLLDPQFSDEVQIDVIVFGILTLLQIPLRRAVFLIFVLCCLPALSTLLMVRALFVSMSMILYVSVIHSWVCRWMS